MAKRDYVQAERQILHDRMGYEKSVIVRHCKEYEERKDDEVRTESVSSKFLLERLRKDLNTLRQENRSLYNQFRSDNQDLKKYIDNPSGLSPEDWEKLKHTYDNLHDAKKMAEQIIGDTNEKVVDKKREESPNLRHNVRKGWWPI
jgi:hypothetical protein